MILDTYRENKAFFGRVNDITSETASPGDPEHEAIIYGIDDYTYIVGDIILPHRLVLDNYGAYYGDNKEVVDEDNNKDEENITVINPIEVPVVFDDVELYVSENTLVDYILEPTNKSIEENTLEITFNLKNTEEEDKIVSRATLLSKSGHCLATRCFEPMKTGGTLNNQWYWNFVY